MRIFISSSLQGKCKQGFIRTNRALTMEVNVPVVTIIPILALLLGSSVFHLSPRVQWLGIYWFTVFRRSFIIAMQEMMTDVLLVTNAIRNSLKSNQSGQPSDDPMGISIALSPTTVVSSVSRAITNASFRAKKLPDDIPILESEANENQLSSINEESEDADAQQSNQKAKKHGNNSTFVSGITKTGVLQLRKTKDKKKEKDSVNGDAVDNGKGKW
ncbi:hyccin [Caerostris extrusa]|uniref:Hyccin n=1 Tax=Caerostris extrusa TaxID=172846 RepID=A0AAV4T8D6_CAEEX|nr:hyccin [Caerostris extrusa]